MQTGDVHYVAYKCHDTREKIEFYPDNLGLDFSITDAENVVPPTGIWSPYIHVFLHR